MSDNKNSTDAPDTGHVWDDNLRELTNQPPRWWIITFYLGAVFIIGYLVLYPSIPLVNGSTKGVLGWTQMKRLQASVEELDVIRKPFEDKLKGMSAQAVLDDRELSNYVVRSAKVLFGDRCAACHGTGGAGNPGYPILADDDWLFGGNIDTIQQTITNGRTGLMPAFKDNLTEQELDDLAKHILALSQGSEHAAGKELYNSKGCFGCHGMEAKGVEMMGGANFTDAIWRFAPGTEESIKYTITNGVNAPGNDATRIAIMPVFKEQLTETEIKKLAVYVHKLGGGQ
jgi:cytochrome c oxidase cbb3-type subunit 3